MGNHALKTAFKVPKIILSFNTSFLYYSKISGNLSYFHWYQEIRQCTFDCLQLKLIHEINI